MDKFYYIVAQLPSLVFDMDLPISRKDFLAETKKWMSKRDYLALSVVDLETIAWSKERVNRLDRSQVLRRFKAAEIRLRSALAEWRKSRIEGRQGRPADEIADLLEEGNPLQIEKKLLLRKWETLDELEKDHDFDLDFLIIYLLRLQILEKSARFVADEGMRIFMDVLGMDLNGSEEEGETGDKERDYRTGRAQ